MICSITHRGRWALVMILLATVHVQAAPADPVPVLGRMTGSWQLLVDDYLVSARTNITRRYHPLQKYSGNPIVVVDKPWEADIVKCTAVLPTEDGSGYRMWYSCWTHKNDPDRGHSLYAVSKDGLRWEKPDLGMIPWKVDGSTHNNLAPGTGSIMHTPWEKDPELKYHGVGGGSYIATASPDGMHWKKLSEKPSVSGGDVGRFLWDPFENRYLAYVKVSADVRGLRRRAVGFSETKDLRHFHPLNLIMAPDDFDDRWAIPGSVQRAHFYGCTVFPYETMYLGLLWIFRADELDEGYFHGPMFLELISSRDGVHWLREEGDRPPILDLGKPPRSWDGGMLCPVTPIRVNNEIRVYYSGYDGPHDWLPFRAGIGLATMRKDGFASLDAGEATGEITTKRFKNLGKELHVNCQARSGELSVELIDEQGRALPGYARTDCDLIQADSIDQVVTWHGRKELPGRAEPTRFRFVMRRSTLYSFDAGKELKMIEDPAPPEMQALYTFEGGRGRAFSDLLAADGTQAMHTLGTARLNREPAHAAFGSGSMSIGSQFRPLCRLQIEGTRSLGTHFTLAAMVQSSDQKFARLFSSYRGYQPPDMSEVIFDFDPRSRSVPGLRLTCKGIPVSSEEVSFADGKYHHLGVVYDNGSVDFYLDGKGVGRRYLPGGAPVVMARDLLVGEDAELGTDEQLKGHVDDVLVLGRALTPGQMAALHRDGAEKALAPPSSSPASAE